jgi:hypothetical protein
VVLRREVLSSYTGSNPVLTTKIKIMKNNLGKTWNEEKVRLKQAILIGGMFGLIVAVLLMLL